MLDAGGLVGAAEAALRLGSVGLGAVRLAVGLGSVGLVVGSVCGSCAVVGAEVGTALGTCAVADVREAAGRDPAGFGVAGLHAVAFDADDVRGAVDPGALRT